MKKYTFILFVLSLAFTSCSTTDVWKKWENEGTMSENRLRPSEVKKLLYSTEVWKMDYENTEFYFQFSEGGAVITDSDASILKNQVDTDYYLDYKGENTVLLTIVGKGIMQYLTNDSEEVLEITQYSSSQITAHGQNNSEDMVLVPSTISELNAVQEVKRKAIIDYNKQQSLQLLKASYSNGIIRNANSNVMAHYSIICDDDDNWSVTISCIVDNVLTHNKYDLSLNIDSDEKASLNFEDAVDLQGILLNNIFYNYDNGELTTDNSNLNIDLDKASSLIEFYNSGDWHTHKVDLINICTDLESLPASIEFDDRSPRNIVFCPNDTQQWFYTFFTPSLSSDDALTNRIYFKNNGISNPYGGYGDDIAHVEDQFATFIDFIFSEDGLWMFEDADSYVYVISPTTDMWFRMKN